MSMYEYPIARPATGGRLSILICTPDSNGVRFRRCYDALKNTTQGIPYDLRIFDNGGNPDFSHAREINKALSITDGPLLTMDDDVVVSGNWLQALLDQLSPSVGIISPTSTLMDGRVRQRGATFTSNGKAVLFRGEIEAPIYVPCVGSCCSLINTVALRELRYSREYKKYCFDPDLSFRLWERGISTMVIPEKVIHDSGGAMRDMGIDRAPIEAHDGAVLKRIWIDSGRLQALCERHSHLWPEELRRIL